MVQAVEAGNSESRTDANYLICDLGMTRRSVGGQMWLDPGYVWHNCRRRRGGLRCGAPVCIAARWLGDCWGGVRC